MAFECAEFERATVNSLDYHVEADGHYYSCSRQLAGSVCRFGMTAYVIECPADC